MPHLRAILATFWMLAVGPALAEPSAPPSFSPAQRAEIVTILRDALKTDPSILREAVLALQRDENGRAAAASAQTVAANRDAIFGAGDPVAGNPDGRVTLVEFFDVRCPYCRRMQPDMARLLRERGDVRLILKDLPVLGPASVLGARALLGAAAQGGYLKMQAALMAEGAAVDEPMIERAAEQNGLDWPRLKQAMNAPAVTARIAANLALANRLGIQGTPALVVGDQLVSGALDLGELRKAVGS